MPIFRHLRYLCFKWFFGYIVYCLKVRVQHTSTAGSKYRKLTKFRRLLDFAHGQNQELRNVWKIIISCWLFSAKLLLYGSGWPEIFLARELKMEEELLISKGKVGMLIIVFKFAENTKGETDFYSGWSIILEHACPPPAVSPKSPHHRCMHHECIEVVRRYMNSVCIMDTCIIICPQVLIFHICTISSFIIDLKPCH